MSGFELGLSRKEHVAASKADVSCNKKKLFFLSMQLSKPGPCAYLNCSFCPSSVLSFAWAELGLV